MVNDNRSDYTKHKKIKFFNISPHFVLFFINKKLSNFEVCLFQQSIPGTVMSRGCLRHSLMME